VFKKETHNYRCINNGCYEQAMKKEGGGYHSECQKCENRFLKKAIGARAKSPSKDKTIGETFGYITAIKNIEGYNYIFRCVCGQHLEYNIEKLDKTKGRHCGCVPATENKKNARKIRDTKFIAF
jgi:hypothetical protein